MRVRGRSERNPLLHRQLDDPVARVKLLHGLAPSRGGKLNRQILRANKVECFINQTANLSFWPMSVDPLAVIDPSAWCLKKSWDTPVPANAKTKVNTMATSAMRMDRRR